jgi:uncharacterized membrane protein
MTLGYPVALHIAVIHGYTKAAVWMLFGLAVCRSLLVFTSAPYATTHLIAPAVAMIAMASLAVGDTAALYLPPVLIATALFQLFAHTLLPGEEPLLCRFARHLDGVEDERRLGYARTLTWFWTFFFAAMLVEAVLLALFAPIEIWSLFTNFVNYIVIAGLLLLQLIYRSFHLRRLPNLQSLRRALELTVPHQRTRN